MKIIADKNIPFLKGIAEQYGDVTYLDGSQFNKDTIRDADTLLVRTVTHFDKNILEGSSVKLICSATIGYDHIDTNYCDTHNITWTNAPGCNSGSVQQYLISALTLLSKKKGISIKGKTIGIIGVGNVGKKIATACKLLGMHVLLNDPPRQEAENDPSFVDLQTIQQESDFITFHTPLTKEGKYPTYHLADRDFFQQLTKKPFIINSARGSIIDTQSIKEALRKGQIAGAIIDCWEKEPNIDLEYMHQVDIATPHIAGYSADGKANATRMSLQALAKYWNMPTSPIDAIKVPSIENSQIDYGSIEDVDKLSYIFLKTYNPLQDMLALLSTPDQFSKLRAQYPLRREYMAYTLTNVREITDIVILKELGFSF